MSGADRELPARVCAGIRPENLVIRRDGPLKGQVVSAFPYGMETTVVVRLFGMEMRSVVFGSINFETGQEIGMDIEGEAVSLFDPDTEELLSTCGLTFLP